MTDKILKARWTKTIAWCGKVETVECKEHSYAWSGQIPCTGIRRCIYCGKPAEDAEVGNVTSTSRLAPAKTMIAQLNRGNHGKP